MKPVKKYINEIKHDRMFDPSFQDKDFFTSYVITQRLEMSRISVFKIRLFYQIGDVLLEYLR